MTKDEVARIAEWAQNLVNAHERRSPSVSFATLSEREAINQLYALIEPHVRGVIRRRVA